MRIPIYDFGSKFSVVQEVMRLQTVKHFLEPVLEPLIRKVVRNHVKKEYSIFSPRLCVCFSNLFMSISWNRSKRKLNWLLESI